MTRYIVVDCPHTGPTKRTEPMSYREAVERADKIREAHPGHDIWIEQYTEPNLEEYRYAR